MITATLTVEAVKLQTWDAIIIGAGPAGALAARQLASAGARVLLVERKIFPRTKVCGACLNGQALALLRSIGLQTKIEEQGGVPLSDFRIRNSGREAAFPLFHGLAISRGRLDALLVHAAIEAGANFLPETTAALEAVLKHCRIVRLDRHGSSIRAAARVVLVAGGLGWTQVEAEMGNLVDARSRVGAGCLVDDAPMEYATGTIWMALGRGGYVGLVRVEDGRLNVAAAFDREFMRDCGTPGAAASRILSESGFPPIRGLESETWQGTVSLTRHLSVPASERVLVIGDAAGYVEPFTGEGIAWALASAQTVVPLALQGINAWRPALREEWLLLSQRLLDHRQRRCRQLALALRQPWLVFAAMRLLSWFPAFALPVIHALNRPLQIPKETAKRRRQSGRESKIPNR